MASINPYYTFQYSQPGDYRFSHDSVFLARRVFELVREEVSADWRILDLCAGCGIVGMDFLYHCRSELQITPKDFDFLEIQSEYEEHFEINKQRLHLPDTNIRFLNRNYVDADPSRQYNLILCNPPYFNPRAGKLSPSPFKNRCRFFMDATPEELIAAIERSLLPGARAYVLSRSPSPPTTRHLRTQPIGDIRGTPLICYERLSPVRTNADVGIGDTHGEQL